MQAGLTLFRFAVLLSGVAALSACTTVQDPKVSAADVAAVKATESAMTVEDAEQASVKNNDGAQVLALTASGASDPALPDAAPRSAAEAVATVAQASSRGGYNRSGEVKYKGVTKSGTANHLVEARAEIAANSKPELHNLIGQYAAAYQVPERLVHRVVQRESRYNPAARNGPYLGLMQISHATARGMGYQGSAQGLLNANTNLRYAVKYLAGAYKVADGNETQAVRLYARGYYYDAKRKGLLEETGLRKGPNSIRTAFIDPEKSSAATAAVNGQMRSH